MRETILFINFKDPARLRKCKAGLLPLKVRMKTITPEDYEKKIGILAGVLEEASEAAGSEKEEKAVLEHTELETVSPETAASGNEAQEDAEPGSVGSETVKAGNDASGNEASENAESETAASGDETSETISMEKEMLVFVGIGGMRLDAVLRAMKKAKITVDYKAVLTEQNGQWTVYELYQELAREHEAFRNQSSSVHVP